MKKDKSILFIVFIIIASTFHYSALVGFVFFIAWKCTYSIKIFIEGVVVSIVGALISKPLFDLLVNFTGRYQDYINSKYYTSNYFGALAPLAISLIMLIFSLVYFPREEKSTMRISDKIKHAPEIKMPPKVIQLCFWAITFEFILAVMNTQLNVWDRIRLYFHFYSVCLLPWAISREKKPQLRMLFEAAAVVISIAYFYVVNSYRPLWTSIVPYEFFF